MGNTVLSLKAIVALPPVILAVKLQVIASDIRRCTANRGEITIIMPLRRDSAFHQRIAGAAIPAARPCEMHKASACMRSRIA